MNGEQTQVEHKSTDPATIAADIAKELREHPERWFQGHLVRFKNGNEEDDDMLATASDAVCWCLEGHICKRVSDYGTRDDTFELFRVAIHDDKIHRWNDMPERTVDDVIRLCEKVANERR